MERESRSRYCLRGLQAGWRNERNQGSGKDGTGALRPSA